jgi:serine/threonine protein kinase
VLDWRETGVAIALSKEQVEQETKELVELGLSIKEQDFQKIKCIGAGAFATVYLVKHIESGTISAMKKIRKNTVLEADMVKGVIVERQVMARANHPYLMEMHFAF